MEDGVDRCGSLEAAWRSCFGESSTRAHPYCTVPGLSSAGIVVFSVYSDLSDIRASMTLHILNS